MSPARPGFDAADGVLEDAIISGNFSLETSIKANGCNLFFCEFGIGASFAAISCPVFDFVSLIGDASVPTKICQVIIERVAVIMAALHFIRPWANKCRQNQCMNPKIRKFSVFPDPNKWASIQRYELLSKSVGLYRPYVSMVRNFVKTLIPSNWQPMFHTIEYGIKIESGQ